MVRARALQGRFGVDHSELMNYELEQSNKAKTDHMNWLVYKDESREPELGMAKTILSRLKVKDDEMSVTAE